MGENSALKIHTRIKKEISGAEEFTPKTPKEIINQVKRHRPREHDRLQKTGREKYSLSFRHGRKQARKGKTVDLSDFPSS